MNIQLSSANWLIFSLLLAGGSAMAQISPVTPATLTYLKQTENVRVNAALAQLHATRNQLGLDSQTEFAPINTHTDHLGQTHTRFQQHYNGVKVWGGEIIAHTDPAGQHLPHSLVLEMDINLNTTPRVLAQEALAIVYKNLAPHGPYATTPKTELVIYTVKKRGIRQGFEQLTAINASMVEEKIVGRILAHHVHVELRNKIDGIQSVDYMINANSGEIIKKWSSLETLQVVATGAKSLYNGVVSINTNSTSTGFELRDMLRGAGGKFGNNVVLNYASETHAISQIFTDTTNTWGDGLNYLPGVNATSSDTAQTAGVDIAFGTAKTWDFYKNVLGRNGIDGVGTATYAVVHDPLLLSPQSNGKNAYWYPPCFCMHYGDGNASSGWKNVTALDVAAHEMSHGVTAASANLVYADEPGGLNEATSDIFAAMVEFYARGGGVTTIPATGGNWTIGEGIKSTPLRYMYKPSLDGVSFDAWSLNLVDSALGDVHYTSGPMNRAFYFLSQGASTSGNTSTTYLSSGMTGIGNDHAGRIWYRALTAYMTSTTNYIGARQASISAAKDLYGAGSAEEKAVWNAFAGINVGQAWSAAACGVVTGGREFFAGESISACNSLSYLIMQTDGNLVLYKTSPNTPLWHSGTYSSLGAYAVMQADGNLVVYKKGSIVPAWNSGTYSSPGATAAIQNDGNMVITSPNGIPVWYLTPPANVATIFTASGANTTFATANVVDPTKTGVTGRADPANSQWFRLTVAAGKTVTLDFVGAWLAGAGGQWSVITYNNSSTTLSRSDSYRSQTRLIQSYTNATGLAQNIYVQVYRASGGMYEMAPFTMSIKYN